MNLSPGLRLVLLIAISCAARVDAQAVPRPAVLAFPQPGLDDSASYQGYQTRFYKDAAGNTVQIYVDQRSGRIVHLLANSEDESAALSVRAADGSPVQLSWTSPDASVSRSGRRSVLSHQLAAAAPEIRIGWFLLGSMRVERDFQYQRGHLAPYAAEPFQIDEWRRLVSALERLGPAELIRHLSLIHALDIGTVRARLRPTITRSSNATAWIVRAVQPSLDGRDTVSLEVEVDPRIVVATRTPAYVSLKSVSGGSVPFTVRVSSTARPLTPLTRNEIFTDEFLRFVAASDTTTTRGKWLERQVRGVELLSSREKLMAGLPAYATYFGRDMMVSALMMRPIWRDDMSAFVVASVLRKLGPAGDVSHEEALGGQATREAASEYAALVDRAMAARASGNPRSADSLLARAAIVLRDNRTVRENYHMIDDEFHLPVLTACWLTDPDVTAGQKRAFLIDASDGGVSRLTRLLREFALVARMTAPYVANPTALNLVSFAARENGEWGSASWRDSGAGYAGGRFAMDINAIWAPAALEAIGDVIRTLPTLGIRLDSVVRTMPELTGNSPLGRYMRDSSALNNAIFAWWGAGRHFLIRMSPAEVRTHVQARLAALPENERRHWTSVLDATRADADSLEFLALSLDAQGRPIDVVNTDVATRLFLGESHRYPDPSERDATLRDVRSFVRAYPVALFVDRVGPVVANDAYAPPSVWPVFEKDRYHGPRVVWGREVNLFLLGAAERVHTSGAGPSDPYVRELRAAMDKVTEAVRGSGFRSELWSYDFVNGAAPPVPVRYGSGSDVQLWSTTDLAVQFALSRLPH